MYLNVLSRDDGVRLGVSRRKVDRTKGWRRANFELTTQDLREAQSVLVRVQRRLAKFAQPDPTGFWTADPKSARFAIIGELKKTGLYRKAS